MSYASVANWLGRVGLATRLDAWHSHLSSRDESSAGIPRHCPSVNGGTCGAL
jgi:hypothetical protein